MNRFRFATTKSGKCDVTITLFTNDNTLLLKRSITFDIKPTIKELKERYKEFKRDGAKYMRITTTPGWMSKTYRL